MWFDEAWIDPHVMEFVTYFHSYVPVFSKLSRHYFHWMPHHNEGTWKKYF